MSTSILEPLFRVHPPKCRDDIIRESEALILLIQQWKSPLEPYKLRDRLFYLHIGLIPKLIRKYSNLMCAEDVLSTALLMTTGAARKYDVAKGHDKFTWVSFFMRRVAWEITNKTRVPCGPVSSPIAEVTKNHPTYANYDVYMDDVERGAYGYHQEEEVDDSLPSRWDAVFQFETANADMSTELCEDLRMFKMHYLNKSARKIARRLEVTEQRVREGIERATDALRVYYSTHAYISKEQ